MDREIEILSVWNVYSSYFFFQTKWEIYYWTQGSTLVQKTTNGDVFDPTDIRNELLLSDHVFKLICIKLEASLLWDVDLLAAREPGSLYSEPQLHVPYFAAWYEWTWHPGQCEPWCHCALGLHKGTIHTCLEHISPSTGQHLVDWDDIERMESHCKMKASTTLYHVLAQIQAVSRT